MSDKIKKIEYDPHSTFADEVFHANSERTQTYVGETIPPDQRPVTFLSLQGTFARSNSRACSLGLVMERHELLELGRYIVRVLDPSPEDKILGALDRIETKLTCESTPKTVDGDDLS